MTCTYSLNTAQGQREFPDEVSLRDYIRDNPSEFTQYTEQHDIPETFEAQRDQFTDRWKLEMTTRHGEHGYTSRGAQKATLDLAKKMAKQLEKSGYLYNKLNIRYDQTYGLIRINPKVDHDISEWQGDLESPSYDIGEEKPKNPRVFQQLPDDFPMKVTDQTRYFLSPRNVKNDTYSKGGDYFNVDRNRTGNAQQLAKAMGVTPEVFKERIAGSHLQKATIRDFLTGKNTTKMTLYKVDRVTDPAQFVNPNEDQSVGGFRRSKIVQQQTLLQKIRQTSDTARRAELYKELNRVKTQIKELAKPANQNMAYLKKSFLDDRAKYTAQDFSNTQDIDRSYSLFNGYEALFKGLDLEPFGEEVQKEFADHLADIHNIKRDLVEKKYQTSVKYMETKMGLTISDDQGRLLPVKDISDLSDWFLAMSTTNSNSLVRFIGSTTNFAVNKAKDKTSDKKREIKKAVDDLVNWGKTAGLSGPKLYDYMLEEDENGKPTGHFVVKYGTFYNQLSKTLRDKDEKKGTLAFLKFLRNNSESIEGLTPEFKAEWQKIYDSTLQKIKAKSPDLSDDDQAAAAIAESNRIAYGIDPQNFIKVLDKLGKGSTLDDKDLAYVKNFVDRGGYYKFVKIHPKDEFRDRKFAELDRLPETDPRKAFYRLFSDLHYEVNSRVRVEERATLRRNFIAEYKKDYKDEDQNLLEYLKDTVKDWLLHQVSESPRDNIQGLDPLTKEIERSIPFYGFDGRISPEDKNYNLGKVLGVLAQQYYHYEALSDVEDDLLTAQYVLSQVPVYEVNSFGNPVTVNGEPVIKKDTSAMYKQADYHILSILYNERQAKGGVGGNHLYDAETTRRIKELDKLAEEQEEGLTAEQAEEYRKLKQHYTSVTLKKVTNALMNWTSIKNIGFNLFGGMAEIFQGTTSLYLRYGGKAWFNTTFPTLLGLMNPMDSAAKNKMKGLQREFHIEADPNPNIEESKFKKTAYFLYSTARLAANTGYLVAILKDQMIKDKSGIEHSLYDVIDFDENGKYVLPANFDNPFYNPDGTRSEYKYKLQQIVNKEIKQNRDRERDIDPIRLDKYFWGEMLGQFKDSWLFEGFAARLGAEKEALNDLDKASKGIYRSFWDLAKAYTTHVNALGETETSFSVPKTLLKALINVAKYSTPGRIVGWGKKGTEEALDYEGAVRTIREVQSAIFLYGMAMMVSALAGGATKDDWKKNGWVYLSNYFMRTQRDMSTWFDPNSLTSIVNKNIVPVLGTVDEATKLVMDPFHGIFQGNWYYNQGKASEQLRIARDAGDLIPVMNQLRMTINKTQKNQSIFY